MPVLKSWRYNNPPANNPEARGEEVTCTVKDVIEKLQEFDENLPVAWHWEGQILCVDTEEFHIASTKKFNCIHGIDEVFEVSLVVILDADYHGPFK